MGDGRKVETLTRAILDLPEGDREQLAREVLPLLLTTRTGLRKLDEALESLPDAEIDALIERARTRLSDLPESAVAAVIGDALRAVRAPRRS